MGKSYHASSTGATPIRSTAALPSQVPKLAGWRGQGFQFGDPAKHAENARRHDKLKYLAAGARSLALAAEQDLEDCILTSQLALTVRRLAGVLDRPDCEDISRAIDQLGQQIQAAARGLQ